VPVSSPSHPCHSSLVAYQGACERYFERWRAERDQLRIEERWWETLSGTQFEIEVERLLRKRGSHVSHVGGAGDGGIDLLVRPSDNETPIPVQCKAHRTAIGPAVIRDFYGAMKHCGANEDGL
jgi:restriction endonuclease Mrr